MQQSDSPAPASAPVPSTATVFAPATVAALSTATFPAPEPDSFYPVAEHVPDWTDFPDPDDDDLAPATEEDDPSWARLPDPDEDAVPDEFPDPDSPLPREPARAEPFPDPDSVLPREPVRPVRPEPEPFPDPDSPLLREPVGAEWDSPENLVGRRAANGLAQIFDRIEDEYEANIALMAPPWPGLRAGMAGGFMPGHVTVLAGPPGVSKSYFALNILSRISSWGIPWRLLPLEDDAKTWVMKMLAVIEGNWRIVAQPDMDDDDERMQNADIKREVVTRHEIIVQHLFKKCIAENPRTPIRTAMGMVIPDVTWTDVLDYIQREGEAGVRLICIDPMSQINFGGGGQEYRNQERFVSRLVAAAAGFGVHVLLVAHTVKQARHLGVSDTLEGIQGSAMLTRLAHNVLVLSRHNEQEGLLDGGGTVRHRLTLGLPKCRNGFSGTRYAYDLTPDGPCFIEHGVLQV